MSIFDDIAAMSVELDDEFAVEARVTPMVKRPNRYAEPDPDRAPYILYGVFLEQNTLVGTSRGARGSRDGLSEVSVPTTSTRFSYVPDAGSDPEREGDRIEFPALNRTFVVTGRERLLPGRRLLRLEAVDEVPSA